jgi:hypothetical protein
LNATDYLSDVDRSGPLGAYGLRVDGLEGARDWMSVVAPDAPRIGVRVSAAASDASPSRLTAVAADLRLRGGGRLRMRRDDELVEFCMPSPPAAADLLHPFLAPAAALTWQWRGEEALHAGAVAIDGHAVLLLGAREAGKSTTLRWLAEHAGLAVLSDDLAVIVGGRVLAGPRSLDLRDGTAAGATVPVRSGERSRLTIDRAPGSLPLGAIVVLEWGAQIAVTTLAAADRLSLLAAARSFPMVSPRGAALLELAAHPMVRVCRPRDPANVGAVSRALLAALPGGRSSGPL